MKLYKYFHPDRIDVLRNGKIRFSQPGAFNDPYEMQMYIDKDLLSCDLTALMEQEFKDIIWKEYKKLPKNIKDKMSFNYFWQQAVAKKSHVIQKIDEFSTHLPNQLNDKIFQPNADKVIGVLCLTERKDNLLMWAHYALDHKGFVIEFDTQHPFFNHDLHNEKPYHRLNKVNYSEEVPKTSLLDLESFDFILTKSLDWRYEEEWRMIRPLKENNEKISATPFDLYLFSIPCEAIIKIILGCRHSIELKSTIQKLIAERRLSHVILEEAKLNRSKFGLNFAQIDNY